MFAVIMAGGGGTRLWPKSREHHPKQIHALVGAKPLVQEMTERLHRILGNERVYIITNAHHAQAIGNLMPSMAGKILVDPYRRDTAACIGLAAVYLSRLDPDAVMGVFAADHFIDAEERFGQIVLASKELAAAGHVVTIGIRPTGPETGYGYIEMGELFGIADGREVYAVRRFVEKPDIKRAEEYVAAGNYLWNSALVVWSIPTVLSSFKAHLPDTYARLMRIREALGTPREEQVVSDEYKDMQRISVDYGVMEKLDKILVIPGDFDWNDIGSWATVCDIISKDSDGNAIKGRHVGLDTRNCLIVGADRKIIATIGIEDLIVVDSEDALLVCRKDQAQEVKHIVDKLKNADLEDYL